MRTRKIREKLKGREKIRRKGRKKEEKVMHICNKSFKSGLLEGQFLHLICFWMNRFSLGFSCLFLVTFTIVSATQQFSSFCYLASCKKKEGWGHRQVSVCATSVGPHCFSIKYQIPNSCVFCKHRSVFPLWIYKFDRKAAEHGTRIEERFCGRPALKSQEIL